ncbi:HypC/HybG/HupF family hydrogenase formation chaperone [Thiofaba sp. EF100]|jgi:hydrogenase expression/formation protein HypC|uniref:HypC/HybG/HupF family hydrogenase formation chaperone n=1 Tax=Thiofaba sp. EF100 TaxID=3121274 RepID=UPI0032220FD9
MCLAIPMQIVRLEGDVAVCRAKGVEREVSLFLLQGQELAVGDFVMVHVGYAIQKVEAGAAGEAWALWRAMREAGDA